MSRGAEDPDLGSYVRGAPLTHARLKWAVRLSVDPCGAQLVSTVDLYTAGGTTSCCPTRAGRGIGGAGHRWGAKVWSCWLPYRDLEGKIETVAVEVNLLRADLRMVSEKVKVVEGSIVDLQTEVGTFRKQMAQITSTVGTIEARLQDSEGRSRWNNVRLLGFPEWGGRLLSGKLC
ncbi:hypothetical protein NDU88_005244 [Pleurodeles waltl]|uniref:Uncharacterized protein n=1 Tax=Pleurodeles waltl TaxID=8319 RepID=A0AAV7MVU2_PLEWA|nr:hypothetical protein NDU88_005244 [Pleurodeles waltl]